MVVGTFLNCTWKYQKIVDVSNTLGRIFRDTKYKVRDVKIIVMVAALFIVHTVQFMISLANMVNDMEVSVVMSYVCVLFMDRTKLVFLLHFTHVAQSIAMGFEMVKVSVKEVSYNVNQRAEMDNGLPDVEVLHTTRTTPSKIEKLRTLMNTYWMLCDAVHQANDFYCDQLMTVMFSLFVHVTIMSYFFFLHVRAGEVIAFITEAVWVLLSICYAFILVNSSTRVTKCVRHLLRNQQFMITLISM
ncbi:hypothetical protein J6590_073923 [Homalodisca vitripennis]|nr:hypothetical protein J6590_073923 [Homalodisca vitripennis]